MSLLSLTIDDADNDQHHEQVVPTKFRDVQVRLTHADKRLHTKILLILPFFLSSASVRTWRLFKANLIIKDAHVSSVQQYLDDISWNLEIWKPLYPLLSK